MARVFKWVALVLSALVLATAIPAEAATPATGSLSSKKKMVTFNGGPFGTEASFPVNLGCDFFGPEGPGYDTFVLKVLMGEGATFKVSIIGSAGPIDAVQSNDFDLCVFYPDGTVAGESGSTGGKEQATIKHKAKFRGRPYTVAVLPYLMFSGASYKGTATVTRFVK